MASVYGPLHIRSVDLRAVPVSGLEILPYEHFSPTLVTRAGFFLASDEELRRTQVVYTSGEALTETGNRA